MSRLVKESSFFNEASTSQEGQREEAPSLPSNKKIRVTLLSSEWKSSKGGLSTINRELAIQLAQHPNLEVSVYLPQCSEDDRKVATSHNVQLLEAEELPGFEPIHWLSVAPPNHDMDFVVGHGVRLGRYVQHFKRQCNCNWIHVVHTAPEELGLYKTYEEAISNGEKKHQDEVKLCEMADQVVAVGPKLKEAFARCLRSCQKDQAVLTITPSIFSEFSGVKQATEERKTFSVLVLGRGDNEDFELKGYDIVARAIEELKEKSYRLVFVGATVEKGDEVHVAQKLQKHGIDRSQLTVRCFSESREQLAKLFCEADLAIMPSRTEGFGLAGLEAMSAGLPVLVSGNSGFGEALKKVPNGSYCVVDSEDPKDWAKKIRAVREKDRELRLEEASSLRDGYAKKFSWQEQCGLLVERMQNLTSGTSTADEQDSPVVCRQITPGNLQDNQGVGFSESLEEGTSTADEQDSPVVCRQITPGNLQDNQGVGYSESLEEGPSERLTSRKGKRSLSPSGTPSPKKSRLATDGHKDHNVVKILKAEYKRRSQLKPLLCYTNIQLPIEDVYTRLKIVSRRKADFRLESNVVDMCDIFESFDKGDDTMTLIEGSPGIGKTTFCLKVANDWANKTNGNEFPFPKFELVLLLKCRDIDGEIMEAVMEQLLPEDIDEKNRDELMDYIKDVKNQEKILIVLDGLDELPQKSKVHVDKLLKRRILPFCYVLATCRQERGISARTDFEFDVLWQIEGFTEENSFEYIRKHFKNACPDQPLNGEKLIREIQENTLLHALCTNPLNLLLLCVVFEDYEGELPTSRTKLYKIIVRCLLRRYCAKQKLKAPDDDNALDKQFKESILALGELAWNCLLKDRHSFLEEELIHLESVTKGLVARLLGLVFKEASLKRLKPQHEYYFLHKTFQEYLAALYLVHRLQQDKGNVFEQFSLVFADIVTKYRQVFLFVCGILDKEASILFRQIGEGLKSDWDWHKCREEEAIFFTESFSESRNPEKLAVTLCSFLPFPWAIEIDKSFDCYPENFVSVLKVCKGFSQLQQPVCLTVLDADSLEDGEIDTIRDALESCLPLKTLKISGHEMTPAVATALYEGLSANTTLLSFSLDVFHSIPSDVADIIGKGLAASKTLTTAKFTLREECRETWASALEKGLSAETPLTSVDLKIDGSMSPTGIQALAKLFSNKSLTSLCLIILGEMQDLLASAVSKGLTAAGTVLKSFSLWVVGGLSCHGAFALEKGFLKNRSLTSLLVKICGEPPKNWITVVQNVFSSKKSLMYCNFYPNPNSEVTDTQINHLHSVVLDNRSISDHSLTLNLWGELSCVGAETLGKLLRSSSLSRLTLNVHGKLADGVAKCIARHLQPHETLSSVTVNIWCELTEEGRAALQSLSDNTQIHSHPLDFQSQTLEDSVCKGLDDPFQLIPLFHEVKEYQKTKLCLKIDNYSGSSEDWAHNLSDGLKENLSLTSLILTINNFSDASEDWAHGFSENLEENSSLTSLILKINNFSDKSGKWGYSLVDGLAKFRSLTELSLTIDDHSKMSEFKGNLADSLIKNKSLSSLSITINCSNTTTLWRGLGDCLRQTVSLTTLSLTINNYSDVLEDWADGLDDGLAKNTSISTLNLVVNNYSDDMQGIWGHWLGGGLAGNTTLTTLILEFNNYCYSNDMSGEWADDLLDCLAAGLAGGLVDGLADTLADAMAGSLADDLADTLSDNLTDALADGHAAGLAGGLVDGLADTLAGAMAGPLADGLEDALADGLTDALANALADPPADGLADGLANNKSITTICLTISGLGYTSGDWAYACRLGDALAKNSSLTALTLTINNITNSEASEGWLQVLCDTMLKSESLTTLKFIVNNQDVDGGNLACSYDLSKSLAECRSLTSLDLTASLYGEAKCEQTYTPT